MRRFLLLLTCITILITSGILAQTGKIAGTITDGSTDDPLIGVNILVEGTTLGSATDLDGYYSILNVPPGTYRLKVSMIGYAPKIIERVRVNIDQTTLVDVELIQESIETSEIVVVAEAPIVQRDVSASGVNLNAQELEVLPVVSVQNVVNLQAGIDDGVIRGGSGDEIVYQVNGITLRDGRNNTPYNNISFTSVDQIKVQTGGFTAEMGDARSGVVEVVTKEGSKDHYMVSFYSQISPYHKKHFGPSVNDPNSFFLRPFLDEDVAWTGVNNGAWDEYTRRQYVPFQGWNAISQQTLQNDDPSDDLTPEAARELFLWQHRKKMNVDKPDYDIDFTAGGPVPVVGKMLGDLRFLASYKSNRTMLLVPLSTEDYTDYDASLKLTSDLQPGMKLMAEAHFGEQAGTSISTIGSTGIFRSDEYLAYRVDYGNYTDAVLFSDAYFTPTTVKRNSVAFKFTHVVDPNTFYQVILSSFTSDYNTQPGDARDTSRVYRFGADYYVDEAPLGYYQGTVDFINGAGMLMGSIYSQGRDKSIITNYNLKFDITSQLDKYNQVKAGIDFRYTDNNTHYMLRSLQYSTNNRDYKWHTFPIQGAFYIQDKLEFEEMVANIGIRFDYSDPNTKWFDYDYYDRGFTSAASSNRDELIAKTQLPRKLVVSPRLGIAFPITVDSKLFFNYGHFQALPTPDNLYQIRYAVDGQLEYIANPAADLEKTIQYELGYEHNLFDQFLLRLTGYYKDISNESRSIDYISSDNTVNYTTIKPVQYRDIRGFEFQVTKNRGDWVTGFFNYTYMLSTLGKFGWGEYYESKVAMENYIRTDGETWYKQDKPKPRPYARLNLDFFTPNEFGPELSGVSLLGDWRINLLSEWKAGEYYSWTGRTGLTAEKRNNLQWKDYFNVDLRISKGFNFGDFDVQLFVQVYNLFNFKRFSMYAGSHSGFSDNLDERNYFESLHLSDDITYKDYGYTNIPGDDQPGDYRAPGSDYTPIRAVQDINTDVSAPDDNLIYYDAATSDYYEYVNSSWQPVNESRINKILDDKSYIDMPNFGFFTFLNKREIFYGVKINITL